MNDNWEPCPRCGSNRVRQIGKIAMFFIFLGSGSCLLWAGILFPPIWIVAGILILASPLSFIFPKMNQCEDCKKSWKAGHAEDYKKAIDDINNTKK